MERYKDIERSIIKTYRKNIWRRFIKGVNAYSMMNEGDVIAVCISGGADSFALAKCAQEIQRHGKFNFALRFIAADTGFGDDERQRLSENANILNVPLEIFEAEGDLTDCLLEKAKSLGCGKIALGSTFDDSVETVLGNMLCHGKIAALMPKEKRGDMEIIRPLYNVRGKDILAWARFNEIEFAERQVKKAEIKELVKRLRTLSPYIEKNIRSSVCDVNLTTVIAYHGKGRAYNFLDDYDERGRINA